MEVNNKNILSAQDNIQLVATQKVMSAEEFAKKCIDIASNYKHRLYERCFWLAGHAIYD